MKKRQYVSAALACLLAVSLTAGCSSSESNSTSAAGDTKESASKAETKAGETVAEDQKQEPVTLRFSWWGGDARHEATLKVIKQFEEKYPWITIEPEYSAFDGYNEKKMTEFASGTAPDIFQIETGSGPNYNENGVLYNLSETDIDFSNFDAKFLKDNGQFGTGSQYGVPVSQAGSAIIVNKTLADKIGIDLTKDYDWNQLIEWGEKVQEYDPETYLFSVNSRYATSFFMRAWCRQKTGKALIDSDLKLNMTEAQFEECFNFIKSLYDNKVFPPASYKAAYGESDQEDPNWIAGKYVGVLTYTSMADVLQAANPSAEYIAGNLPLAADRVSDGWYNDCSGYIGIYAKSQHPKEAAMFVNFFFNDEKAIETLGTVRSVPPTARAKEICEKSGSLNPLAKMAVETSLKYNGLSDSGKTTTSEVEAILKDAYDNIAYGAKTPADEAREIVQLLSDYIESQK
ncbi:extracellular solute-binding protein [Lacrimispora sp.]|uniref:ABC transporter substrate-binding protein n=1 Tax=Lacrimispora sp. TaxID=2719234 RepID=UPI0032E4E484